LDELEEALVCDGSRLRRRPDQLFQDAYNHLFRAFGRRGPESMERRFVDDLLRRACGHNLAWLRCAWGHLRPRVRTMAEHTGAVSAVAVLADGRVVSGSGDGTVKLWDPAAGTVQTMAEHTNWVRAVAVLADGRVVSGSTGGTVFVGNPIGARSSPPSSNLVGENFSASIGSPLASLAEHPKAPRVVVGLRNGRIMIFDIEPEASRMGLTPPRLGTTSR
jgi:hypothetical protein